MRIGDFGGTLFMCTKIRTGKMFWRERGIPRANTLMVGSRAIILDEAGVLRLANMSPEGLKVIGSFQVLENLAWTPPSIAGTRLYVRGRKSIAAIELKYLAGRRLKVEVALFMAFRWYLLTACLLLLVPPTYAAGASLERGSWNQVQRLEKGASIKITMKGDKTRKGAFAGITDASLLIVEGTTDVGISKDAVLRVEVKSSARRVRNALIGVGVGLALGVVIDQSLGAYARNETGETTGARVATVALPPALFGGIAAAFPGYRTVYRAPKGR